MKFNQIGAALVLSAISLSASATFIGYGGHSCGGDEDVVCTTEWSDSWTGRQFLTSNLSRGTNSWEFTFDITDDGFKPGEDIVNDYSLGFKFSDDGDIYYEWAKLFQAGEKTNYWEVDMGSRGFDGSAKGIAELNESGLLTIKLLAYSGDFYLTSAELNACGIDNVRSSSVPEPASVALLGIGLLALGFVRRNQHTA